MHGITMIFLYALPILSGFSNYLWPLVLGARDMAFPRVNAFSYWVFLFAGILLYASFPMVQAPNAGWFNYVPLSSVEYNPGPNIDVYALGMILLGISTTIGSVNFVVTLIHMRAAGMSLDRLPILVWGVGSARSESGVLDVMAGSPSGHAFLRRRQCQPADVVATSFLDVRSPLGVRRRTARDGHRI